MESTYLFLDCEWADTIGSELVSLALVSADGEQRFYAERDPLPAQPTDFVRAVVYPLLDRGTVALPDTEFTVGLRRFLCSIPAPCVLFDYPNDGALLRYAIEGFELPTAVVDICGPYPLQLVTTHLTKDGLIAVLLEDWFQAHPAAAARRHHALVDAEALRQAWCAATGRQAAPWSPVGHLLPQRP